MALFLIDSVVSAGGFGWPLPAVDAFAATRAPPVARTATVAAEHRGTSRDDRIARMLLLRLSLVRSRAMRARNPLQTHLVRQQGEIQVPQPVRIGDQLDRRDPALRADREGQHQLEVTGGRVDDTDGAVHQRQLGKARPG
jgi:hypothetical protein